jgi:hypothetical protein
MNAITLTAIAATLSEKEAEHPKIRQHKKLTRSFNTPNNKKLFKPNSELTDEEQHFKYFDAALIKSHETAVNNNPVAKFCQIEAIQDWSSPSLSSGGGGACLANGPNAINRRYAELRNKSVFVKDTPLISHLNVN